MNIWFIIRVISGLALVGFLAAGAVVIYSPQVLTGEATPPNLLLLQSLSGAFMATISAISLMLLLDPSSNWKMLLPLAVGKATSSLSSLGFYMSSNVPILFVTFIIDGIIAIISSALYVMARSASMRLMKTYATRQ